MDTAPDLFDHELRATYDAAKKMEKALGRISSICRNPRLVEDLSRHRAVAENQVERLERAFSLIDRKARRRPCTGINGLIEELSQFLDQNPSSEVLDVYAGRLAGRLWQYLSGSYETLIDLARLLDIDEAAGIFLGGIAELQRVREELQETSARLNDNLQRLRSTGDDFGN